MGRHAPVAAERLRRCFDTIILGNRYQPFLDEGHWYHCSNNPMDDLANQSLPSSAAPLGDAAMAAGVIGSEGSAMMEISRLVRRHAWLIGGAITLGFAAGVVAFITVAPTFVFKSVIEVGRSGEGALEASGAVVAKMNEAYIPKALARAAELDPLLSHLAIDAQSPKETPVVIISARGADSDGPRLIALEREVIDELLKDHAARFESLRRSLQIELDGAVASQKTLRDLLSTWVTARSEGGTPSGHEGTGAVSADRAVAEKDLDEANRRIVHERSALERLQESRVIMQPMRSTSPVGVARGAYLVIGAALGMLIGLLAAYLLDAGNDPISRSNRRSGA